MVKILGTINMSKGSVYNGKRIADVTDEEKADIVKQMSRYCGQCVIEGYNDGREGQESQDSQQFSECAQPSDIGCQVQNVNIKIGLGDPDYWTRLEHQYAGMAMQGLCANTQFMKDHEGDFQCGGYDSKYAHDIAHALVERLRDKQ